MRIERFHVINERGILRAECTAVPRVMVIAGPNGAGKSTLLNALRNNPYAPAPPPNQATPFEVGKILYVGPNRSPRKYGLAYRSLLGPPISLESLLSEARIQTPPEGVPNIQAIRDAWDYDSVPTVFKHALAQLDIQLMFAIKKLYDTTTVIDKAKVPDIWEPLRDLLSNLLPHLAFLGVQGTDQNIVKVEFSSHGATIDFDELSSGEKALITLFYPLVEERVRHRLLAINAPTIEQLRPEYALLIDEPEIHLHPALQLKAFDYLRGLTEAQPLQVIITTQSPEIVDYATSEELYLLKPPEATEPDGNQLVRVADGDHALRNLRTALGSNFPLTALQPIVVVEGVDERRGAIVSDRKLFRALSPRFDRVNLVAAGGKSDAIRLGKQLADALSSISPSLRVAALVDRDIAPSPPEASVTLLPVSTIENFLLDAEAIWDTIQSAIERTAFPSVKDLDKTIESILAGMREHEINRRVLKTLGYRALRPKAPIETIASQISDFVSTVSDDWGPGIVEEIMRNSTNDVDRIVAEGKPEIFKRVGTSGFLAVL